MRKIFLIFCGVTMFCFINYGFIKWLHSGHQPVDVWQALTQDWLLLITVTDACIFTLFVFTWLLADMKKRDFSMMKKTLVFFAVLVTGVSAFFIYLAFRPKSLPATIRVPTNN